MLARWQTIKQHLNGDPKYWGLVKDAVLPELKAKVIRSATPNEVLVAASGSEPEIKLILTSPPANPIPAGTELTFNGVAEEFQKSPFLLTIRVGRNDLRNVLR